MSNICSSIATSSSNASFETSSQASQSSQPRPSFETPQNSQVIKTTQNTLTYIEVYQLLKKFDPSKDKNISTRIESAHGGEVYIFYKSVISEQEDWRCDNFNWYNQGANKPTPHNNPVLVKHYWNVKGQDRDPSMNYYLLITF
jgi:hypothetical protein